MFKLLMILFIMIQRYNQFGLFRKGSENSFSQHFVHDFFSKIFLMLYSINWPNCMAWLPLLFEILANMFIEILC